MLVAAVSHSVAAILLRGGGGGSQISIWHVDTEIGHGTAGADPMLAGPCSDIRAFICAAPHTAAASTASSIDTRPASGSTARTDGGWCQQGEIESSQRPHHTNTYQSLHMCMHDHAGCCMLTHPVSEPPPWTAAQQSWPQSAVQRHTQQSAHHGPGFRTSGMRPAQTCTLSVNEHQLEQQPKQEQGHAQRW